MIRRQPRSTHKGSSAATDVYQGQNKDCESATLEVSSQGLSRIKFAIDNYDSEYFLVSTQAVN